MAVITRQSSADGRFPLCDVQCCYYWNSQ